MSDPLAYFLTWHTYGTWFHGDERGSVDRRNDIHGEPFAAESGARQAWEGSQLRGPSFLLDERRRHVVQDTILEVCRHRGWRPFSVHVRTTHAHAVLASGAPPESSLSSFKGYATRRLREAGLASAEAKVWSRHGSTRYLWDEASVWAAVVYVVDGQGSPLAPPPFVADEFHR